MITANTKSTTLLGANCWHRHVNGADRIGRLAEKIDADGEVIETENGPKVHPAIKEELAGRNFIVKTLQKLGLNLEPVHLVGRPTSWKKRQEERGADE